MFALAHYNPLGQSLIHMLVCFMRQSSMQSKAFMKVMTVHFAYMLHVDFKVLIVYCSATTID